MINLLPWTLLQLGPFGGMEIILIIIAVAVFLFGTKKIPEMARSLGKATGEFRKGKVEMDKEVKDLEGATIDVKNDTDRSATSEQPLLGEKREALIRAAKELGISTEGKSDNELRRLVRDTVGESNA